VHDNQNLNAFTYEDWAAGVPEFRPRGFCQRELADCGKLVLHCSEDGWAVRIDGGLLLCGRMSRITRHRTHH